MRIDGTRPNCTPKEELADDLEFLERIVGAAYLGMHEGSRRDTLLTMLTAVARRYEMEAVALLAANTR